MSDSHYSINFDEIGQVENLAGGLPAGDEDRPDARGLSTCHIPRKYDDISRAKLKVWADGSLVAVDKNRINPFKGSKRDWVRGEISGFSRRSRSRLMRKLAKIDKTELPLFITLTYPDEFPTDSEIYKSDLEKFAKRMKYRFPKYADFWKLEFQKRGAPHFHLLVWGIPKWHMKQLISYLWYKVVGSGDEKHLKAGTNVQRIRSWRGVMSYAAKYMTKLEAGHAEGCGRFWGVHGSNCIPWSDVLEFDITEEQAVMAMRMMRKYADLKGRDYPSLTIFVNNPIRWVEAITDT